MPSHSAQRDQCLAGCARKNPRQRRGEEKVEALLAAGVAEFSETGYEGATMSAIAARAGASIGSLYQFFPNKESVARALRTRQIEDARGVWARVGRVDLNTFVREYAAAMIRFVDEHPAFVPLLDAPPSTQPIRPRLRIKRLLVEILGSLRSGKGAGELETIAETVMHINRAMLGLYARAAGAQRARVAKEYRLVLGLYLGERIGGKRSAKEA